MKKIIILSKILCQGKYIEDKLLEKYCKDLRNEVYNEEYKKIYNKIKTEISFKIKEELLLRKQKEAEIKKKNLKIMMIIKTKLLIPRIR